jgi:hypothetical protein
MLDITCFVLTDHALSSSSVAQSSGQSSDPNNLFWMTHGRLDLFTFFFFLSAVQELAEGNLEKDPMFEPDEPEVAL